LKIIQSSISYTEYGDEIDLILEKVTKEVFTETEPFSMIGFRDENNGTTSYYSTNVTSEEAKWVDEWCQEIDISPLNTRLLQDKVKDTFELLVACSETNMEKYW